MRTSKGSNAGPERYVLGIALLVPLVVAIVALSQLPGTNLGLPSTLVYADTAATAFVTKRPAASQPAPPPTLAPPSPTPRPTATAIPAGATPTAVATNRTYTVKKGDELKHIAADYNVSIWKIIDANDIPDPDSLRIGQELSIPDKN
jgi:hypothetical protein